MVVGGKGLSMERGCQGKPHCEGQNRVSQAAAWKGMQSRGNSKCKGPRVEVVSLPCAGDFKEAGKLGKEERKMRSRGKRKLDCVAIVWTLDFNLHKMGTASGAGSV